MNLIKRLFFFYFNGFKSMTWGKTLWIIILIKAFVFFVILRMIFFPNFLNSNFDSDAEKADHVMENITNSK